VTSIDDALAQFVERLRARLAAGARDCGDAVPAPSRRTDDEVAQETRLERPSGCLDAIGKGGER